MRDINREHRRPVVIDFTKDTVVDIKEHARLTEGYNLYKTYCKELENRLYCRTTDDIEIKELKGELRRIYWLVVLIYICMVTVGLFLWWRL